MRIIFILATGDLVLADTMGVLASSASKKIPDLRPKTNLKLKNIEKKSAQISVLRDFFFPNFAFLLKKPITSLCSTTEDSRVAM